ncbi:hypothetical protein [Seleniivibrio woodruffii]|uniref:hypothetical protein n=1 Tax=Seleniivibrio woodruffii TaxID=1078050 RepID=UPI0026EF7D0F|nr:hypothetical protein [Seleniivibrio woodruffii]
MRTIIFLLMILLAFSAYAQERKAVCEKPLYAFNYQTKTILSQNIKDEDFRRGCCSHHGGVCGCSGGRALCCDGSLSPSCGCD